MPRLVLRVPAAKRGFSGPVAPLVTVPSHYGKVRRFHGPVSRGASAELEDAIVETSWMLDEHGGRHSLDGSTRFFAGQRRRDYHYITRWSPMTASGIWGACSSSRGLLRN